MLGISGCKERRLYFKWCAKRAMGEHGNLLRFIGASLIMLAVFEAFVYSYETVCYFILGPKMSVALLAAELLIGFIVLVPLFMSLARMSHRMAFEMKTELSDILWAFSKDRIRAVYIVAIRSFFGLLGLFCLSFVFGRLVSYAFEGIYVDFFSKTAMYFALALVPVFSGVFSSSLILPTAFFETDDLSEAISVAKKSRAGQALEISAFNVSFVPLFVLSLFTFGIMLFVYFLPFYMIAFQICASYFIGCNKVK